MGVVRVTRPAFLILPQSYFLIGEARHFRFCVLIDAEEYEWMHDILHYSQKGLCSKSHDLFKFWEISDSPNSSLTVQDRDIVAM